MSGCIFGAYAFRNCQVAAPLKRVDECELCRPDASFRNCQVAAPLKHFYVRCVGVQVLAFRNCQVAAPLKQNLVFKQATQVFAFRNCQVAAPLKRVDHLNHACDLGLPQLSSCGPIEARWSTLD